MHSVTTVVLARNEEARIGDCLRSVRRLGEIVVVDTGSADRTVAIAEERGARVVRIPWTGFVPARRRGMEEARTPWILMLDADERLTDELRAEIEEAVQAAEGETDGFRVPRRTRFLGREMRRGGWSPDRQLRLFRKGRAWYEDRRVHEFARVKGRVRDLRHPILHLGDETWEAYLEKMNRYTTLQAADLAGKSRAEAALQLLVRPPATFAGAYLLKLGFLDGLPGFLLATGSAFSQALRWIKVWEGAMEADRAR